MSFTCDEYSKAYWANYVSLEKEFLTTLNYVTLDFENFDTFSGAYIKLMLEIGSEVDVVLKFYCKMLQDSFSGDKISDYRRLINSEKSDFYEQKVKLINKSFTIRPWINWGFSNPCNPYWWTAYNKIKHERTNYGTINSVSKEYYKFANLRNVLYAMAGLYHCSLSIYYELSLKEGRDVLIPLPGSRLFRMSGGVWDGMIFYQDYAFYIKNNRLIMGYGNGIYY